MLYNYIKEFGFHLLIIKLEENSILDFYLIESVISYKV